MTIEVEIKELEAVGATITFNVNYLGQTYNVTKTILSQKGGAKDIMSLARERDELFGKQAEIMSQ